MRQFKAGKIDNPDLGDKSRWLKERWKETVWYEALVRDKKKNCKRYNIKY